MNMKDYKNPVIKGFHSDPSICIVGEDAYLVVSTFEFFPGVPVYHSKNLVDWTLINYCLPTSEHLNLEKSNRSSQGIFAPSIRYNNGTFYMITTNVSHKGNFIVKTNDIYGEWSEPIWIDHKGIDPSLLFDDDGKVYFTGTGNVDGQHGLILFEINPDTGEILSDKKCISQGTGGKYPEGPHIYHLNDYYYLMVAEGGTEYGHMETMLRSKNIWGPYESCPHNPIMSNKDSMTSTVQCTGHADIACDINGNWWMVCLGVRPIGGHYHHLGREVFLVPMKWENGWPVVSDDKCVYENMSGMLPGEDPIVEPNYDFVDDFSSGEFNLRWTHVCQRLDGAYNIEDGKLLLKGTDQKLSDTRPIFIGIRQTEFNMVSKTRVFVGDDFTGEAGICAYYSDFDHYSLSVERHDGELVAIVKKRVMGMDIKDEIVKLNVDDSVELKIETSKDVYSFYACDKDGWKKVGTGNTAGLCTETCIRTTFTGTFLGVYAVDTVAKFDYFEMKEIK